MSDMIVNAALQEVISGAVSGELPKLMARLEGRSPYDCRVVMRNGLKYCAEDGWF